MEYIKGKDMAPLDVLYAHVGIKERIHEVISDALDNREETQGLRYDSEEAIYMYPWLRIIVALLDQPRVTFKIANLVSKQYSSVLAKEDETALRLVAYDLGMKIERLPDGDSLRMGTVTFQFRMPFLEYLKIATSFKSPPWKLVNRLLRDGQVFLRLHDLVRIIEEVIKNKIIEIPSTIKVDDIKDTFLKDPLVKSLHDDLLSLATEKAALSLDGTEDLPVDDTAFPPCLRYVLDKNAKGINLAHTERLFMVYFLLTIGKTTDEIIDMYRNLPDFNEKITKYQVEFAAGKHGKQTKYKPHNCVTLESLGICKKSDPVFGDRDCVAPKYPFKNPLVFYHRRLKHNAWVRDHAGGGGPVDASQLAVDETADVPGEEPPAEP
jgi:DNA primase large subunit